MGEKGMKRTYQNLGKVVRQIRKSRHITQVELAEAINIHPQFVSNVERGLCAYPKEPMRKFVKQFGDRNIKAELKAAMIRDCEINVSKYVNQVCR